MTDRSAYTHEEEKRNLSLAGEIAEEGIVLLENNGALPIGENEKISLFGIAQIKYAQIGDGSGGVRTLYTTNFIDGLKECGAAVYEPLAKLYEEYCGNSQEGEIEGMVHDISRFAPAIEEMDISDELIATAAAETEAAVFFLKRSSGEGRDRTKTPGDYYLTEKEYGLLKRIRRAFGKMTVVLNVTGVMDTAWLADIRPDAVLLTMLAGMEGGLAAGKILTGKVNPSGKLPDTWALKYEDYPSSANFGAFADGEITVTGDGKLLNNGEFSEWPYWGMVPMHKQIPIGESKKIPINGHTYSLYEEGIYTGYRYFETFGVPVRYPFGFGLSYTRFSIQAGGIRQNGRELAFEVLVKNTGDVPGKEVVQVYFGAPDGKLERPAKELCAFQKTALLKPGESQKLSFQLRLEDMAAFDEKTASWILESGDYRIFCGNSVKAPEIGAIWLKEAVDVRRVRNLLSLAGGRQLRELSKRDPDGTRPQRPKLEFEIPDNGGARPEPVAEIEETEAPGEAAFLFKDVRDGLVSMEEFVRQLTDVELIKLLVGGLPNGLERVGIPVGRFTDGPAGVGRTKKAICYPCGTLCGATWNPELIERMGEGIGSDAVRSNIDIWHGPGLNIHRNPLCGRNFEYYSEDPFLSGKMTAAAVRGVQSKRVAVNLKHFAVNNQETNRFSGVDAIVSERALREIYLRGFEIAVRESEPWGVMTSYNSVNGAYTATRRDLICDLLRDEWGYTGFVISDAEGDGPHAVEAFHAGNDYLMPGFPGQRQFLLGKLKTGELSRTRLQEAACKFLECVLKTKLADRM